MVLCMRVMLISLFLTASSLCAASLTLMQRNNLKNHQTYFKKVQTRLTLDLKNLDAALACVQKGIMRDFKGQALFSFFGIIGIKEQVCIHMDLRPDFFKQDLEYHKKSKAAVKALRMECNYILAKAQTSLDMIVETLDDSNYHGVDWWRVHRNLARDLKAFDLKIKEQIERMKTLEPRTELV